MSDERELKNLRDAFPGIWVREDGAFRSEEFGVSWSPGDVEGERCQPGQFSSGGLVMFGELRQFRGNPPCELKLSQIQALADYITAIDSSLAAARIRAEREVGQADIAALSPAVEQAAKPSARYETTVVNGEHVVVGTLKRGDDLPMEDHRLSAQEIPEGFTKWEGGECPVDESALVEYQLRGADSPPLDPKPAFLLRWNHAGVAGDIIAYRISPELAGEEHDDPTAVAIAAHIDGQFDDEAQPDPADLPPPTEAEFNALPKFESVFVSEQPVSEEILERVREHFEENPPQVLAYAEPAPVVSELDEGTGR